MSICCCAGLQPMFDSVRTRLRGSITVFRETFVQERPDVLTIQRGCFAEDKAVLVAFSIGNLDVSKCSHDVLHA